MSKKVVYKENEDLPVVTSYLERLAEEVLTELSDGKGDEDDGVQ